MAKANWTVMVLMGANNIPGEEGPLKKQALDDLKEMQSVGSQNGILNIAVQLDLPAKDGGAVRFKVTTKNQRAHLEPLPQGWSERNVLEDFVSWAKKRYPAEHYLLVLWGHAYRLAFNRAPDNPDGLDFPKLSDVLQRTNNGKKLDIVGFDSCNICLIEGAYQLRNTASFLVASQFSDPLPGWPYDTILQRVLNDRNYSTKPTYMSESSGPKDLGRAIVSQFVRSYEGTRSATMTMLDLGQAEKVGSRLEALAMELTIAVHDDEEEQARVEEIFKRCQVPSVKPEGQPGVDLMTFCWHLATFSGSEDVRMAAAAVGDSLLLPNSKRRGPSDDGDPFIVAHGRSDLVVAMLQGVSIFAPNLVSEAEDDRRSLREKYDQLDLARRTKWGDLVFSLAEAETEFD